MLYELEKYLFDLRGYLLVENALSGEEVDTLNRLIDRQGLEPGVATGEARFGGGTEGDAGFLDWGKPFCDLLDHERIMPLLRFILGDGFRLDHYYGIFMRKGTEGLRLHGGGTPYDPPEYYHFQDGAMHNGLVVVGWNLVDCGPEHGGFLCVPGSHKANYPVPHDYVEQHEKAEPVVVPHAPAGSAVIFTEALTHGTMPWKASHERRSLLFKYSPAQQSWGPFYPSPPKKVDLTERQRLLFEKPYFARRPSLFDGG
ncbi:MAG: phytanoyl-CoA dioxygenase family protein [Chloroflexota bacterium]